MFQCTRVPCWVPGFDPQTHGNLKNEELVMSMRGRCWQESSGIRVEARSRSWLCFEIESSFLAQLKGVKSKHSQPILMRHFRKTRDRPMGSLRLEAHSGRGGVLQERESGSPGQLGRRRGPERWPWLKKNLSLQGIPILICALQARHTQDGAQEMHHAVDPSGFLGWEIALLHQHIVS